MKWYKCFIHGENFPGVLIEENTPIGFYVTRFVQADNLDDAENIALLSLKQEKALRLPDSISPSPEAKVYFEKITEVYQSDVPETQTGFTFYVMGV